MEEVLTQAATLIADIVDRPVWPLRDDGIVSALTAVETMVSQLTCVSAALVRELDARGMPAAHGASSTAVWLRDHARIGIRGARHLVELGRLLDDHPALRDALAAGVVNPEQVGVIGAALSALPPDLDAGVRDKAEALLLDQARQFEPGILHRLGERVLSHVAPEIAEEALRGKLERDEARAYVSRTLTITTEGSGRSRIIGWLDTEAAAIITAALDPLCRPASTVDGIEARTPGQRRADALTEICRLALATTDLPDNGGERPHLTVTVAYDCLTRQLGPGMLDGGQTLPPSAVRRLACDAQIIPAVLGGDGAVLDMGRTRRLYAAAARRALVVRDGGCAFPGCDRPPRWCDGHHMVSWVDGGGTDLDNGVLLCAHHHRVIHRGDWSVRMGSGRRPEFIPPAYVDPRRQPRINTYHRRP